MNKYHTLLCIAGKNDIAVKTTKYVLQQELVPRGQIRCLFTRADNGSDSFQPSFRRFCRENDIPEADLAELAKAPNLVLVSLQYDQLLPVSKWRSSSIYNVHFSLLPKYRGVYALAWALLNGEYLTGVTLHEVDDGIDTGNIVESRSVSIMPNDTCRDLYFRCLSAGASLAQETISSLISGNVRSQPQPALGATYYPRGSIDFTECPFIPRSTAFQFQRNINSRSFREFQLPVIFGHSIERAVITPNRSVVSPSTVVCEDNRSLIVATLDYDLELQKAVDQPNAR